MTAVLVDYAEMERFLFQGDSAPTGHADVIQEILDHTEGMFLDAINRRDRPFLATADSTARTEVLDGTGSRILTLDYPISALATDIVLGLDSSDPDETLEYDDVEQVVFVAGKRTIERTDGGVWGYCGRPRYVHVTYKAAVDMPESGKLAIKRAVALVYRQLGAEDASRDSLSGYSRDMARFGRDFMGDDPIWMMAVRGNTAPRV